MGSNHRFPTPAPADPLGDQWGPNFAWVMACSWVVLVRFRATPFNILRCTNVVSPCFCCVGHRLLHVSLRFEFSVNIIYFRWSYSFVLRVTMFHVTRLIRCPISSRIDNKQNRNAGETGNCRQILNCNRNSRTCKDLGFWYADEVAYHITITVLRYQAFIVPRTWFHFKLKILSSTVLCDSQGFPCSFLLAPSISRQLSHVICSLGSPCVMMGTKGWISCPGEKWPIS